MKRDEAIDRPNAAAERAPESGDVAVYASALTGQADYLASFTARSCVEETAMLNFRKSADLITRLDAALAAERIRAKALEQALRWYENPEIYKPHPHGPAFDQRDLSYHARAVLAEINPPA